MTWARQHMMAGLGIKLKPERSRVCPVCVVPFSYPVGQGNDRIYCGDECLNVARKVKIKQKRATLPKCFTAGCDKPANRVERGLCEACYYQWRRTGSTDRVERIGKCWSSTGYVLLYKPDHPLSKGKGKNTVFEHRYVMYEHLGVEAELHCHWCMLSLTWDTVVIDHLNENKSDNRIENLVVACNRCNRARGAMLPFIAGLTCERLQELFALMESYRQAKLRGMGGLKS